MKRTSLLLTVFTLVILFGCSHSDTRAVERPDHAQAAGSEAKILQSWQGDYPVAKLKLLPEKQREPLVAGKAYLEQDYQERRIDYEIFSFFYSVSNDDHSIKFC